MSKTSNPIDPEPNRESKEIQEAANIIEALLIQISGVLPAAIEDILGHEIIEEACGFLKRHKPSGNFSDWADWRGEEE